MVRNLGSVRMIKSVVICATALATTAVPTFAQDRGRITAPATRAEVEAKVKERFAQMDANKDGAITRAEFDAGHATLSEGRWSGKRLAMTAMRAGGMFAARDADSDGRVSLAEALARPLARFDRADANKDGTLTPEERKAARQQKRDEWRAKRG